MVLLLSHLLRQSRMFHGYLIVVLAIASATKIAFSSSSEAFPSGHCHDARPRQAQILLQARQNRSKSIAMPETMETNPSGAAAPLGEAGYASVADRCCQAEMAVFVKRQMKELNLEVCEPPGLVNIASYHSCEGGPQTFAKLTADLLDDSQKRCTWVANSGNCTPRPTDCPRGRGMTSLEPAADCSCHKSKASVVNFSAGEVATNNLGGVGPSRGEPEIRYSNVGTSETGEPFDVVVTALTAYNPTNPGDNNGVKGEFGTIRQRGGASSHFRFSFMIPGTNSPIQLAEVHMTLFDLDGTKAGHEFAVSTGYKGYVTDPEPSITVSRLTDGRTQFSSSGSGESPSPSKAGELTEEQRQNSVMYFYSGVSSIDITFGVKGAEGRNLLFAFNSALNDRCAA